jgi:hypothetical protein
MLLSAVKLVAFNLIVGAAFSRHVADTGQLGVIEVVTKVLYRSANAERIGVLTRVLDNYLSDDLHSEKVPLYDTHSFGYCDTVHLVGLCVNADSWDDDNIGQA